ncbi:MAG: S1C family serine protease [Gammaproteobacteria bacterium]|nr:S1C family serine protease [Gammaproteobacteria bacterium]
MSDSADTDSGWNLKPDPNELPFDFDRVLSALVLVHTRIPENALTAEGLGTERAGNGVCISDDGLILTIGYLITEAEQVWLTSTGGRTAQGYVVGYDQPTGFGLVQCVQPLGLPGLTLGDSSTVLPGDDVIVAGHGGIDAAINAKVSTKREFAGYWEYVLDEAIFTIPAHPNWGGTGLIGANGELLGIGSLLVQQVTPSGQSAGANMIVPINLLKPILDDLRMYGRRNEPSRPWMGMLVQDVGEHLVVGSTYAGCPADDAGLKSGDVILAVDGEPMHDLAKLFRKVWSLGPAGVDVPLSMSRDGQRFETVLHTIDRNDRLISGKLH